MSSITKELYLSILDQTVFRQYLRHLFIFPFQDISYADDALHNLRTGLSRTLQQYPFLAGTVKVVGPSSGILKSTYPEPVRQDYGDIMLTTSHALAANAKFDYSTLEEAGFPPTMLPAFAFCPIGVRNHAGLDDPYAKLGASAAKGYRIPIMCAQATFIPGGLVLSVYAHHSVVDGGAMDKMYEIWSGHVRALKNCTADIPKTPSVEANDTAHARRTLDAMAHDTASKQTMDCPEITTSDKKPVTKPLHSMPYNIEAKVLSIPASRISTLKADLQVSTYVRISTFVVIATLMWTHITRARGAALSDGGFGFTTLGIAADMRKRADNKILEDSMGNMAIYAATSVPTTRMLQPESEDLSVALALTQALQSVDATWLKQRIQYLSTIADPSTVRNAFTYADGPDLFITSWQHLFVNWTWDIPGTAGDGKPSAVRYPSYLSEGGVRILPRKSDGDRDYELLICLEKAEMWRLIEGLGDYVGRVVDA